MHRLTIVLIAALFPLSAMAADEGGYALAIAKFWFAGETRLGCVDGNGKGVLCRITADTDFQVHYAPDRRHALVVVDYRPDASGGARRRAAVTTEEAAETGGWGVTHEAYGIEGEGPTDVTFGSRTVSFVMRTARTGDPRCCPTGRRLLTMPIRSVPVYR